MGEEDEIIGLIPAAGKGLRLKLPYPKELYPIIRDNHYKPVAQFVLENLTDAGVKHIVFVINETKSQLIGYFGNGSRFGCCASYAVQEAQDGSDGSTSPGLAHALDAAYHLVRGKTVFFGMADTIMQPQDVFAQGSRLLEPGVDAVLCLFPTDHPEKFGMVRLAGAQVIEVVDKPRHTDLQMMWGCILWRPHFSDFLHEAVFARQETDFAQVMNEAIRAGLNFRGCLIEQGNYIDLGTYQEIMELDQRLRAD
jgi:glucose-1-phosphate thymidylyltransferase